MTDRPDYGSTTSSGSTGIQSVRVDADRTAGLDRPVLSPPPPTETVDRDRSPQQIERDIEVTRERLAVTIDEIGERVKPANVVRRGRESALAQVRTPDGQLRTERVAPVAAAAAALLLLVVSRKIRARRR